MSIESNRIPQGRRLSGKIFSHDIKILPSKASDFHLSSSLLRLPRGM
jgi:hypothetical protein